MLAQPVADVQLQAAPSPARDLLADAGAGDNGRGDAGAGAGGTGHRHAGDFPGERPFARAGARAAAVAGGWLLRPPRVRGSLAVAALVVGLALPSAGRAAAGSHPAASSCPRPPDRAAEDWPGQQQWEQLEAAGYRLGDLAIRVADVYPGTGLPWYQELANTLHTDTDPAVVRSLLTVATGTPVEAERIYEAERQLRAQPFLIEARIVPVRCADERVDAEVRVRDAWTLQVGAGFGTAGGESTSSVELKDENFLGSGKTIFVGWSEGRERTTEEFGYHDPAVLGSPWTLDAVHWELSDGYGDSLRVAYPVRRADQVWSVRAETEDVRRELEFEQASETAWTARADSELASVELRRLVALDDRSGWRAGVGWRREYYEFGRLEAEEPALRAPPELVDRRLEGPYIVVERFRDRFRSFRNLRAIGVTEDYDVGLDARLEAGRYTDHLGDDDPWFARVALDYGAAVGERDLFLAELEVSGRYRADGDWVANYRSLAVDYYHRTSRRNTVVTHGEFDWQDDPDPEDELYLGGFDGLLAYPDRFRVGDRRWLLHLEDRYTSDLILFDTIQVGYTAFLEAGSIRGLDGEWGDTLADVGAGLRLGSLRSSFGSVSYLTIALPLVDAGEPDDYELVVGSTLEF